MPLIIRPKWNLHLPKKSTYAHGDKYYYSHSHMHDHDAHKENIVLLRWFRFSQPPLEENTTHRC